MTNSHFNQDDPRLTAFILGELNENDCKTIQTHIDQCPECFELTEELRDLTNLLSNSFNHEQKYKMTDEFHDEIDFALTSGENTVTTQTKRSGKFKKSSARWLVIASSITIASFFALISFLPSTNQQNVVTADNDFHLKYQPEKRIKNQDFAQVEIDKINLVQNNPEIKTAEVPSDVNALKRNKKTKVLQTVPTSPTNGKLPAGSSISFSKNFSGQPSLSNGGPSVEHKPGKPLAYIPNTNDYSHPNQTSIGGRKPIVNKPVHRQQSSINRSVSLPLLQNNKKLAERSRSENQSLGRSYHRPSLGWNYQNSKRDSYSYNEGIQLERYNVDNLATINEIIVELKPNHLTPIQGDRFIHYIENSFQKPVESPLSTFSIDVDTASYAIVRKCINKQKLPPRNAVRIEEMVNYFSYNDAPPEKSESPFSCYVERGECSWNKKHQLVRIGIKGKEVPVKKRPPCNLVFLIDVSGSMNDPDKLPLVKSGLEILTRNLTENDRISIVTYSTNAVLVLPPTEGNKKEAILEKIHSLFPNGSTNGEAGLRLAYEQARKHENSERISRVILCTDGDFNVGISSDEEMVTYIKNEANKENISLSVLGFGMGNLKDSMLEKLADNGNGNYAYIDHRQEAVKVFQEELNGTLVTIAKDVKVQVEFNPATVSSYRLIGYDNRIMEHHEFNDDSKDAGDIGAGHHVTALYEVALLGTIPDKNIDNLKYQTVSKQPKSKPTGSKDWLTCKIRYKPPQGNKSLKIEYVLTPDKIKTSSLSNDFHWASAVTAFGLILKNSNYKGEASFDLVLSLAEKGMGEDLSGRRLEFIDLVRKTKISAKRNSVRYQNQINKVNARNLLRKQQILERKKLLELKQRKETENKEVKTIPQKPSEKPDDKKKNPFQLIP